MTSPIGELATSAPTELPRIRVGAQARWMRLPGLGLRALIAPGAVDSPLVDDLVRSLRSLSLRA